MGIIVPVLTCQGKPGIKSQIWGFDFRHAHPGCMSPTRMFLNVGKVASATLSWTLERFNPLWGTIRNIVRRSDGLYPVVIKQEPKKPSKPGRAQMFPFLFVLLLPCLRFVAAENVPRLVAQHKNNSAASSRILSQLLPAHNLEFTLRDNSDGCASGWCESLLLSFIFRCPQVQYLQWNLYM